MKPEKMGLFDYYVVRIIRKLGYWIGSNTHEVRRFLKLKVFHWWYCGECNCLHNGRTIAYDYSDGECDMVCSIGKNRMISETKGTDDEWREDEFTGYINGGKS